MRLVLVAVLCLVTAACDAGPEAQPQAVPATSAPSMSPRTETPTPTPEIETTRVPDVDGKTLGKAREALDRAGLAVGVDEKYSHEPPGTVLQQSIRAGRQIPAGDTVQLTVAIPFPVIPNVVGDKVAQARRTLENRGFDVRVTRQESSQPEDTVISQSPVGGTEARPGRQVTLVVAKPPPPPPDEGGGGSNCTPGYSPCLPPASDYDCAGGTGDGPEYVSGPVQVTGSDPYGLDSDNDGVGCE